MRTKILQAANLLNRLTYYQIIPYTPITDNPTPSRTCPIILSLGPYGYNLYASPALRLHYHMGGDIQINYTENVLARILHIPGRDQLYIQYLDNPGLHPLRFLYDDGSLPALYAKQLYKFHLYCVELMNKLPKDTGESRQVYTIPQLKP